MPIHMGIMCERCRKVHFTVTSPGIKLSGSVEEMYQLTCKPPCPEIREFRKESMHPYRVGDAGLPLVRLPSSETQQSNSMIYEHKVFEIIDNSADGCARKSRVGATHRRMYQVEDLRAGIAATSHYMPVAERITIQCCLHLGSTFNFRRCELGDRQNPAVNVYGCIR